MWFVGMLAAIGLYGCTDQHQLSPSEAAPAEMFKAAGAKVTTAAIPSNDFAISVVELDCTDCPIADEAFAALDKFPNLKTLVLHGTKVSDAGLAALKKTKNLENVDLSKTSLHGQGLRHLSTHAIKNLNLSRTPLHDAAVVDLLEMAHHVVRLNLASTEIRDEGVEQLAALHGLEELDLSLTKITGASFPSLPVGLRKLNLSGTTVVDIRLAPLERLGRLQSLDLSDTKITVAAVPQIKALIECQNLSFGRRRLVYVNLSKTAISESDLKVLEMSAPGIKIDR